MTSESKKQHDLCHAITWQVLDIFRSLIREEEAMDAYAEIYEVAQQEIQTYERLKGSTHVDSMSPMQNQAESQTQVARPDGALPILPAGDASAPHADMAFPNDVPERQLNCGYGAGK